MTYSSNNHPAAATFSTCPSTNSSFSSDASNWDSSSAAATPLHTPTRLDFNFVKLEEAAFSTMTPSCTPERHVSDATFCNMSSMTQEMLSGFQDPNMNFSGKLPPDQATIGYNDFSTYVGPTSNSFGNHSQMSLGPRPFDSDLYSPITELDHSPTENFVVPSQTTFTKTFDTNSPMRPVTSLQFDIQYDDPIPDYDSSFEIDNSPNDEILEYLIPSYNESKSLSTTPSRPPAFQQQFLESLRTSTVLHVIQEQTKAEKQTQPARNTRRQIKKERQETGVSNGIRVSKLPMAKIPCKWPGCVRKFSRQEHFKRHERTHFNLESFPCKFCARPFGRTDNLRAHVRLHGLPTKKSSRTQYHPDAMEEYESMTRKSRKSRDIKTEEILGKTRPHVSGY